MGGWLSVVGGWWVGETFVSGSAVGCWWSTCWWVGGGFSVVDGSVEHLSVDRWPVVGESVEDLLVGWRSVAVVGDLSVVGSFAIRLQYGHPNTEPRFFRTRYVKRS